MRFTTKQINERLIALENKILVEENQFHFTVVYSKEDINSLDDNKNWIALKLYEE